jgi:hypothetical protein
MVKIKRLAKPTDPICHIDTHISPAELSQREKDYNTLSDKKMKTKYRQEAFRPVHLHWNETEFEIQVNFCSNPFCKNHLKPQKAYAVGKSKRYKFTGSEDEKKINCVPDPTDTLGTPTLGCHTRTHSNWSLAREIERLIYNNSVVPLEPNYEFHNEGCSNSEVTFFNNPKSFYKRGRASSNAQIIQCKTCEKYTNILPDKTRTTSYEQKRNDILPTFAEHLINRVPVSSTCKILKIGRSTYYSKLEWLYRCCLEFLETHETKKFAVITFPRIWLNSDMMMYYLNNVRKKGQRKIRVSEPEKVLQTQTVVTSESYSRYVFRADINFDWDINFKQIEEDTKLYKEDHLSSELRKNGKYKKYQYYPMLPTDLDTQSVSEYRKELQEFLQRAKYVDGLHVNHSYTAMAQLFLIKHLVKTDKWRIVSDDDSTLKSAIKKIFAEEIQHDKLHYFVNTFDKALSREDAYTEYFESKKFLNEWAEYNGFADLTEYEKAVQYLRQKLSTHIFYETKIAPDGTPYVVPKSNKIEHPVAMADRGNRYVDVVTNTSKLSDEHLARLIAKVNDNSVNAFLQEIRRSLSFLERPLVTSRGDGKSYIYSNFNPRYAQMAITILRTYYNFCQTFTSNGIHQTPAQRIGIADRVYNWRDIIYKR